jgi:hypothetical protein
MKHVTTNIPSCFGIVWIIALSRIIWRDLPVDIWDVTKILISQHFPCNVLAEFHHLLPNVSKECIAGSSTDQHNCVDSVFPKIHCHGRTQSNQVCTDVLFFYSKSVLSYCYHSIPEGISDILQWDMSHGTADHDGQNWQIIQRTRVASNLFDNSSCCSYWA